MKKTNSVTTSRNSGRGKGGAGSRRYRSTGLFAAGVVMGAAGLLAASDDAMAGPKQAKGKKAAVVGRAETPLGLQGIRGAGENVVVPFTLVDKTRADTDVEVEFGIDVNADGTIDSAEYRPATEDRLDSRNTRRNRKPQKFVTAGDIGASHAYVWKSTVDIQTGRYETQLYQYDDQGRAIPDPDNPGSFLFATAQAGVQMRIRAVRGKGAGRLVGSWVETKAFSLNNNSTPQMSIDAVLPNATSTPAASDENVLVQWTAADPDSEDLNGNNVLDPLDGEDLNGDGVLQQEYVGVAFDWYRLGPGEDPSTMTDEQLAELVWNKCTRAVGVGDTDSLNEPDPTKKIYGTPNGKSWTFAWNSVADVGTVKDRFILRAQIADQKYEQGAHVYLRTPFTLDNWKVFTSAAAGQPAMELAAGRTGATITNLVPGLERSDASYSGQEVLVAGGAPASTSNSSDDNLDVFLLSTESSESIAGLRVPILNGMQSSRSFHTATLLSDGRVLIAGGYDQNGVPVATTEIYDPKTKSVQIGPSLNSARARHAAVLLSTTDVAIFGGVGVGGAPTGTVEIYRFSAFGTGPGVMETAAESLATAQHSARVVLLPNQKVLVGGGIDAAGNAVPGAQIFDPLNDDDTNSPGTKNPRFVKSSGSTPLVIAFQAARRDASFTPLLDGNVLVAGGSNGGVARSSIELFNWQENEFQPVVLASGAAAAMPDGARAQHVASLLGDGSVLIAGGTAAPGTAVPSTTGAADVVRITGRDANGWVAEFLPVNGDMITARRNGDAATIMNGRVMIAGGVDGSGATVRGLEVYTPEGASNTRPKVYIALSSGELSWKYGAPVSYRLVDPELDLARVLVQFRRPGESTWNACSEQPDTIGGEVGEFTAGLTTTDQDLENLELAIDPKSKPTTGDHGFIWRMSADIDRPTDPTTPPDFGKVENYNLQVIPYGAVQGPSAISPPVTVLYNTKPVTTILGLEDPDGTPNIFQGGDIQFVLHVRDIDGPVEASNGDVCTLALEYALDKNGDGQITDAEDGGWFPMTPAGQATGASFHPNPLAGIQSWGQAPEDSGDAFGQRSPANGWTNFFWDALYDLGPPPSNSLPTPFQIRNVWVRATASDASEGFPRIVRNSAAEGDNIVVVRDPDAVWLDRFVPRDGNKAAVKVNEPIDFFFNGVVDPATVTETTLRIYRGGTQVLGVYTVDHATLPGDSIVTFYPQVQSTTDGVNDFDLNETNTVAFPGYEYRIEIPGYVKGSDPLTGDMIRPIGVVSAASPSTYLLVNNAVIEGDSNPAYRFTTVNGYFNDGQPVDNDGSSNSPLFGSGLNYKASFEMAFTHAIDPTTVASPAVTVTGVPNVGNGSTAFVVPGKWTVKNSQNPDGTTTSKLTFVPLFRLPVGARIQIQNTGMKGSNGIAAQSLSGIGIYDVTGPARVPFTTTETFTNTAMNDTTLTTASWGEDLCAPGTLTGFQDSAAAPAGGIDLIVKNGETVPLTNATNDFNNIHVQKGGTLQLRCTTGPIVVRAKGTITIDGKVDFKGESGVSGTHGSTISYSYIYGPTTYGTRKGGVGYNGGGSGGDSVSINTNYGADHGKDGSAGTSGGGGGQGGRYGTGVSSAYYYGAGGGAGGGHARAGFIGGPAATYSSGPNVTYGSTSVAGVAGGTSNFGSGVSAGGGGGGGGVRGYSSTTPTYYYSGGGGGAGAGAVTLQSDGAFTLNASGYIDGRGGEGGGKVHYSGAGGAGAGGGLLVKAGGNVKLDGVIDLRGGRGGPPSYAYGYDTYPHYAPASYGASRYGGDGSPGRVVVEGTNLLNRAELRIYGQMIARQISSIPTTTVSTVTATPSVFQAAGTGTFNYDLGGVSDIRYATFDIPTNRFVNLTNGTGSNSKAIRIWVDGPVNIGGRLSMNGVGAVVNGPGVNSLTDGSTSITYSGYAGTLGGGLGGAGQGTTGASQGYEAKDGEGPAPGKHAIKSGTPGWNNYFCGDSGGAGAGNANVGREGWNPLGISPYYNSLGSPVDSSGNGVTPTVRLNDASKPGAALDATSISINTISSFVGSGGGGGNAAGYLPYGWAGSVGTGGGGGGGLVIITPNTINLTNAGIAGNGIVEARGGDGNPPGSAYISSPCYAHAGGGGGSGGTVYFVGANINVAEAASETVTSGFTFDLRGGYGGGWRSLDQFPGNIMARQPQYNSFGSFGGDGGHGRVVFEYTGSFNGGKTPVNRYGLEESSFFDTTENYRAFAGSSLFRCRGKQGQGAFRSKWFDTDSLRPVMSSLSVTQANVTSVVLQGQGAQSHPHNAGAGTGEPDETNVSPLTSSFPVGNYLDGWRWFRFSGSFARVTGNANAPTLDNVTFTGTKDAP